MALKGRMQAALVLGAYITAVIWVLNWILAKVSYAAPAQLFGISLPQVPLTTGITATIGQKVVEFLNGIISFNLPSIIILYISAVAIVFVGALAIDNISMLPQGKNSWQRLALILLYGTLVFYFVFIGFIFGGWSLWLGLVIWYIAVALAVNFVKNQIRL